MKDTRKTTNRTTQLARGPPPRDPESPEEMKEPTRQASPCPNYVPQVGCQPGGSWNLEKEPWRAAGVGLPSSWAP